MPCSDGSVRKLCAITDNADERVNLVVYDRETGEAIVTEPLFEKGHSVSENSLIAHGRSFIIENNYSDSGAGFLERNPTSYPGVTRIDMNADCTGCTVVWESQEALSRAPRVGLFLSTNETLIHKTLIVNFRCGWG